MCEAQYSLPSSQPSLVLITGQPPAACPGEEASQGEGSKGRDRLPQEVLQSHFRYDFLRITRPGISGNQTPGRPHGLGDGGADFVGADKRKAKMPYLSMPYDCHCSDN